MEGRDLLDGKIHRDRVSGLRGFTDWTGAGGLALQFLKERPPLRQEVQRLLEVHPEEGAGGGRLVLGLLGLDLGQVGAQGEEWAESVERERVENGAGQASSQAARQTGQGVEV